MAVSDFEERPTWNFHVTGNADSLPLWSVIWAGSPLAACSFMCIFYKNDPLAMNNKDDFGVDSADRWTRRAELQKCGISDGSTNLSRRTIHCACRGVLLGSFQRSCRCMGGRQSFACICNNICEGEP